MSELTNIREDIKRQIVEDYIGGMDAKDIAKKYGFKHTRTCYYHLRDVTREQKLEHTMNSARRELESAAQASQ